MLANLRVPGLLGTRGALSKYVLENLRVPGQSGKANQRFTTVRGQSGKANVRFTTVRGQSGKANLRFTTVRGQSGKANVRSPQIPCRRDRFSTDPLLSRSEPASEQLI